LCTTSHDVDVLRGLVSLFQPVVRLHNGVVSDIVCRRADFTSAVLNGFK